MKIHKTVDLMNKEKNHIKIMTNDAGTSLTLFQGDAQATVVLTRAERQQLARELYK